VPIIGRAEISTPGSGTTVPSATVEMSTCGLREVLGQQPEAGNVGRPCPAVDRDLIEGDDQVIARLRALHEHRPGARIDRREIQPCQSLGIGVHADLPARGFAQLQLDRVARRHH
jgi:hypothetical protein